MENPTVSKLRIYPVKALDFVEASSFETASYSFKNDRQFAMVTEDGRYVNGKRTGKVNLLKTSFDLEKNIIRLSHRAGGEEESFDLSENNQNLETFLSDFFSLNISLIKNDVGGLQDMPRTASFTVHTEASLLSLHQSFPDLVLEDFRMRFRSNIELTGTTPFWEEQLFGKPGHGVRFRIGDVEMIGISPRARCNVPPKDPYTGETDKTFVSKMLKSREESLPEHSDLPEYGNLYHFTVNTFLPDNQMHKKIRLGDSVEILEKVELN